MTEYVAGFRFNSNLSHVLLVRKNRPEWQAGRLNGVGGHIEEGESPLVAMCREWEEEVGYQVNNWSPVCILNVGDEAKVYFCYSVSDDGLISNMAADEPVEVYPIKHTSDRLPNLRWLIPMALANLEGIDRARCFDVSEIYVYEEAMAK